MTGEHFARSASERQILIAALATFSANCELPTLTPTCPFYELTRQGPACGEQCRDLLADWQEYAPRERGFSLGGGIEVHRRPPRKTRRGPEPSSRPFDAAVIAARDKDRPTDERHTVSLLADLRDRLSRVPASVTDPEEHEYLIRAYIDELVNRGFNRDELLAATACSIATTITAWLLVRGIVDLADSAVDEDSEDVSQTFFDNVPEGWKELDEKLGIRVRLSQSEEGFEANVNIHRLAAALTDWYRAQDVEEIIRWTPPPKEALDDLSERDEDTTLVRGRWILDRFTRTYPDEWATCSLDLEWRYLHSKAHGCCRADQMRMRKVKSGDISAVLADRGVAQRAGKKTGGRTVDPHEFTEIAVRYLKAKRYESAALIYEILANLSPRDAIVLNNWGFCLVPTNLELAEQKMRESLRVAAEHFVLPRANLAMVLHLRGHLAEARTEASTVLECPPQTAWLWLVDNEGNLRLGEDVSTDQYSRALIDRIRQETTQDSTAEYGE